MSRSSWSINIDWFWLAVAIIATVAIIHGITSDRYNNQTIQTCIKQGKHPVIGAEGTLTDCR